MSQASPNEQVIKPVFDALNDPKWDWRSPGKIGAEIGLEKAVVQEVLDASPGARKWPSLYKGEPVYTSSENPIGFRERVEKFRSYFQFPYQGW